MLRSPLANPMTTPMINPIRTGLSKITRAILNSNGTQYATLSEPVVLNSACEIEWVCIWPELDGAWFLADTTDDDLNASRFLTHSGAISGLGFSSATPLSTAPEPGLISRVNYKRSSNGDVSFSVNGEVLGTTTYSGPISINSLFTSWGGSTSIPKYKGVHFSTRIWKDGDRNTGELVTDLRFDEPDTIYQRNYASPIADENDPDWSGAILQNALPGDWEEISKQSSDDFWLGVDESTTADLSRAGSSDDCEVFLENGNLRIVSYTTNPAWIGAHFSNLKSGPLYQVSFIADEFTASSGLEIIGSSDTDVLTGFQSIDVIPVTSRISVRDRDGHSAGDEYYLHGISIRRKLKYAEGAL
tara:strand:+ start:573 stop:1646 length:1074 start_codon:yes stop_codon:yes gene_type:complete